MSDGSAEPFTGQSEEDKLSPSSTMQGDYAGNMSDGAGFARHQISCPHRFAGCSLMFSHRALSLSHTHTHTHTHTNTHTHAVNPKHCLDGEPHTHTQALNIYIG